MRWYKYIALNLTGLVLMGCHEGAQTRTNGSLGNAVSTSLCGDTYLQAFAPDHISALSWQSRSALSNANKAQIGLPQVSASPEVVLQWSDKVVLFGPGEGLQLQSQLEKSYQLNWTESFEGVYQNALGLMETLGVSNKSVNSWYQRVKELGDDTPHASLPSVLYLTPAGGSAGSNTFVNAAIKHAGGKNVNKTSGWHSPPIEVLLQYKPDIIIKSFTTSDYHSRSNAASPLLKDHFKDMAVVHIDGKYWPCAGPGLLEATLILKEAIQDWHQKKSIENEA